MKKYAVIINQRYYPSVEYFGHIEDARRYWREVVEDMAGCSALIHVVEIVDSIELESPIIEGWNCDAPR